VRKAPLPNCGQFLGFGWTERLIYLCKEVVGIVLYIQSRRALLGVASFKIFWALENIRTYEVHETTSKADTVELPVKFLPVT